MTITELTDQLAEARERVAQLESVLGQSRDSVIAWQAYGLRPGEARMFGVILAARSISRSALHNVLYGAPEYATREPAGPKIIDVRLHHIRRRLGPLGVEIKNVWPSCLEMDQASVRRAKELLARVTTEALEVA